MTIPTDQEPIPRADAAPIDRRLPDWPILKNWPRQVRAPENDFLLTLHSRRSRIGGRVVEEDLASLLRHATMLRERRFDGRFGVWESRSAPAAGGLHGLLLLCLPLDKNDACGLYDADLHALRAPQSLDGARALNMRSVSKIAEANEGTTLQIIADRHRYDACYDSSDSLIWRDAGALMAIVSLVATHLGLVTVPLGRHGDNIVQAANFGEGYVAVGAIHIGSKSNSHAAISTV